MSDKTTLTVRRVMGMVLLLLCAVCAAALVIACVQISLGGEHPFTPESVQAAWSRVAIFVFLFVLAAVAAGLWHVLFFVPSGKQKGLIFPELRLAKAKARLFRKQYSKELLLPLTKQEIYVRSMRISAVAVCLLCALYPLYYLCNFDRLTPTDATLNGQVIAFALPALCFGAAALAYCCAVRILTDISCERALLYAKSIMLLPAPAAPARPIGKVRRGLPKYAIIVVRSVLIAAAVLMIVFGIFNGGMHDVLQKAIKICTECIGLG